MFGSKAFGPTYVLNDDERWRVAQIIDAEKGIFWGKYGRQIKEALEAKKKEERSSK